jgi:hypothetical protein
MPLHVKLPDCKKKYPTKWEKILPIVNWINFNTKRTNNPINKWKNN